MDTSKAKKSKATEKKQTLKDPEFKIENVRVVETSNGDLVFFNLTINGVTIYSCCVVNGQNGDFISFPQQKGKYNKYYNMAYAPLSADDSKAILDNIQAQLNAD